MAKFFSKKNTAFCCSVSMLLFIVTVLLIMVVLVWNYYFTLLNEMDMESDAVPVLTSIIRYCNQSTSGWNIADCVVGENFLECPLKRDQVYYIQSSYLIEAVVENGWLRINKMSCGNWMVWQLPIL